MSGLGRTLADLELRNATTMRRAQEAWDNMAPPEDIEDDDWLTEDQALQQAADELAANPACLMFHLGHMVGDAADSVPVTLLMDRHFDPSEHHAGTLLAMVFEGSAENREAARIELRDRIATRMRDEIKNLANDMLAEQERNWRRQRDDAAMDLYQRMGDTK